MLLAMQYNLFPELFDLTGMELLLADADILNRVIDAENKAQEAMQKKQKERGEHPGMERYQDEEEFWDEVENAGKKGD